MDREFPNSGALFANSVKKSPKAPDYRGEVLLDLSALGAGEGRVKVQLAGWKKVSSKGATFLSLKVSPFQDREQQPRPASASPLADDDIPF